MWVCNMLSADVMKFQSGDIALATETANAARFLDNELFRSCRDILLLDYQMVNLSRHEVPSAVFCPFR